MAVVFVDRGTIVVPWEAVPKATAHACHLRWSASDRYWSCALTPRSAARVLQLVSPGVIAPASHAWLVAVAAQRAEQDAALADLEAARTDPGRLATLAAGLKTKAPLYRHQLHALLHLLLFPRWGLWMGTGTGKTLIVLEAFRVLREMGEVDRLLVVCPPHLQREAWQADARQHLGMDVEVLEGHREAKLLQLQVSTAEIVAVNYEAIRPRTRREGRTRVVERSFAQGYADVVAAGRWLVAFDEAFRIGSRSSQQGEAARTISWAARRVVALTASLLSGALRRLYEAVYTLDGGEALGTSWQRFQELALLHGATEDWWGKVVWKTSPIFVEYLRSQVRSVGTIWETADCVDLPARVIQDLRVHLTDEQRRLHDAYGRDDPIPINGVPIAAGEEPIQRILRQAQVTAGLAVDQEGAVHRLTRNPKLDLLCELLDGELLGVKTIVWCRFLEEIALIVAKLRRLKVGFAEYSGRVPDAQRPSELSRFQHSDAVPLLLATPACGGEGLTINEAQAMVFFSLGYDFVQYEQAIGRNYRIGQDKPVVVYRFVAAASIDVEILKNLKEKKTLRQLVMGRR